VFKNKIEKQQVSCSVISKYKGQRNILTYRITGYFSVREILAYLAD